MDQSISSVSYCPATRGFDNKNPSLPGDSLRSTDFLQLSMTSSITTDRWNHSTTNNQPPRTTPSPLLSIPGAPENTLGRSQNATPKESKYSPLALPTPPTSSTLQAAGAGRDTGKDLITPVSRPENNPKMPLFSSSASGTGTGTGGTARSPGRLQSSTVTPRIPGAGNSTSPRMTMGHTSGCSGGPNSNIQNMHNVTFSSRIAQGSSKKFNSSGSVPLPPPPPPPTGEVARNKSPDEQKS